MRSKLAQLARRLQAIEAWTDEAESGRRPSLHPPSPGFERPNRLRKEISDFMKTYGPAISAMAGTDAEESLVTYIKDLQAEALLQSHAGAGAAEPERSSTPQPPHFERGDEIV